MADNTTVQTTPAPRRPLDHDAAIRQLTAERDRTQRVANWWVETNTDLTRNVRRLVWAAGIGWGAALALAVVLIAGVIG